MKNLFAFGLFCFACTAVATPVPVDQAIPQIQFCREVTSANEALFKADLGDSLIDPSNCYKGNAWTATVHQQLVQQGYVLERFMPARYIPNPHQQRLELIFNYSSPATGKFEYFQNSCELSNAAKQYIATHPQPNC